MNLKTLLRIFHSPGKPSTNVSTGLKAVVAPKVSMLDLRACSDYIPAMHMVTDAYRDFTNVYIPAAACVPNN